MKVQPYALKVLFNSLCSENPRDIQRGKIRGIQFPHIRYFVYFIARGMLALGNMSNISAPDLAILAASLEGDRMYNIGALIDRRHDFSGEKGPTFGGIFATLVIEHLHLPVRDDDFPLPFSRLDLDAMKRHEFVTRSSHWGDLNL